MVQKTVEKKRQKMDDFDELLGGISLDEKPNTSLDSSNDTTLVKTQLAEAMEKITGLESSNSELSELNAELSRKNEEYLKQLDQAFDAVQGEAGKPLMVSGDDIIEDPDKPNTRRQPDEEFEAWLTQNIKEQLKDGGQGIQDPISCRWDNDLKKWIINKGHTRFICGKMAGLKEFPIIIQDGSTDWNQVIENILRHDLPCKDMVFFIQKKLAQNITQKEIGQRLSRDKGWVSKHVALGKPPTFIQGIWDNGYATEFTILYGLVVAYKKNSEFVEQEVNSILAKRQNITKDDVNEITKSLKKGTEEAPEEPELEDDIEGEEHASGDEDKKLKIKTIIKLQLEFEGQTVDLVMQEPSTEGNLVCKLSGGQVMEAEIKDVKILGIVAEEV